MERASGILLHITSLPCPYGTGDFGPEAYRFVDFLQSAGQKIWQVLPLNNPDPLGSPYASVSSAALNTLLISPDQLVSDGLLPKNALPKPAPVQLVDYGMVKLQKTLLVQKSYSHFMGHASQEQKKNFAAFQQAQDGWLPDFSLFMALKDHHASKPWHQWPQELANRQPESLSKWAKKLAHEIAVHEYGQWLAFSQWERLKRYTNEHGVVIIGDLPFFVGRDSVDVWTNKQLFLMGADNKPTFVSGVPPDYFSKRGQRWGEPQYDWGAMQKTGFAWWIERFQRLRQLYDIIRLDHFRGYHALWYVPSGAKTARIGEWRDVPGEKLFATLLAQTKKLPCIAEDLGFMTDSAYALRDSLKLPGMRILLFAFSGYADSPHLPENFVTNCVCYTGSHDNDTARSWVTKTGRAIERHNARVYTSASNEEFAWKLIKAGMHSKADTFIAPMQDVLNLGAEARMNKPSTKRGNWLWRMQPNTLTQYLSDKLRKLTESAGRG
ncbi:MAG: 4-alpha-glucanotransferase [Patescibacteria group bacterium]|nr:4-alpha-glucanotransferase [Patescibacteria group bacterium]MDD5715867.1 4-alpha-glucanotransferase [Patescibacteria group bacterium]